MKKLLVLVLFAIFGFGFMGIEKINAQTPVDFKFEVDWNDSGCNCGSPIVKYLDWEVYDLTESDVVDSDTEEVSGNSHMVDAYGEVQWDCEGCYRVTVTLTYEVGGTPCCTGTTIVYVDGDELLSGNYTVNVTMN